MHILTQQFSPRTKHQGMAPLDEETHDLIVAMVQGQRGTRKGNADMKKNNSVYMRYYRNKRELSVVEGILFYRGKKVEVYGRDIPFPVM